MANHPAEGNIVMLNIRIATAVGPRPECVDERQPRHLLQLCV